MPVPAHRVRHCRCDTAEGHEATTELSRGPDSSADRRQRPGSHSEWQARLAASKASSTWTNSPVPLRDGGCLAEVAAMPDNGSIDLGVPAGGSARRDGVARRLYCLTS